MRASKTQATKGFLDREDREWRGYIEVSWNESERLEQVGVLP